MERAKIANRNNADLFISIHCNAVANSPKTSGAETFIMGDHRNSANLAVAKRENASILYESNAEENYGGFDPNSTEAYIAFSFIQSEFKQRSLEFAELVQNELVGSAKRHDRGVQQAGFLVLYKTAMPSVLVELGFISNPTEEAYMMSADGQNTLASAIAKAFSTYKTNFEKNSVNMQQETVAAEENVAEPKTTETPKMPKEPEKPAVDKNVGIVYKVQFTTRSRAVDNPQAVYKNLRDVDYYEHNGMFKYTAGCFTDKADADAYLKEVVAEGYDGAFVVKFQDGVRK
jgi:N-acetylmuramoyl-L-alanine amidase